MNALKANNFTYIRVETIWHKFSLIRITKDTWSKKVSLRSTLLSLIDESRDYHINLIIWIV